MATYQNGHLRIDSSIDFFYATSANALHNYLFPVEHSHKTFRKWIISTIAHYGFEEGLDFVPEHFSLENTKNNGIKDMSLSLSMAKELARIVRTERGREARYFFMEFEFQLREQTFENRLFDKKIRQLNQLAHSMKMGQDVIILSIREVISLIKGIREYQEAAYFYAPPEYDINACWINDIIDNIKREAGKALLDEE